MPRKTTLSIISERAVADQAAMMQAEAEMEALAPLPAPPQDILTQLRAENAQLSRLVSETAGRAEQAEAALHQTTTAAAAEREQISQQARAEVAREIAKVNVQAQAAIKNAAVAEKTAAAAVQVRQTAGMLASFGSFLVDRAPVLATLLGAYLLARDILPTPSIMQLGLLGIYGGIAVLPAVWLRGR